MEARPLDDVDGRLGTGGGAALALWGGEALSEILFLLAFLVGVLAAFFFVAFVFFVVLVFFCVISKPLWLGVFRSSECYSTPISRKKLLIQKPERETFWT